MLSLLLLLTPIEINKQVTYNIGYHSAIRKNVPLIVWIGDINVTLYEQLIKKYPGSVQCSLDNDDANFPGYKNTLIISVPDPEFKLKILITISSNSTLEQIESILNPPKFDPIILPMDCPTGKCPWRK